MATRPLVARGGRAAGGWIGPGALVGATAVAAWLASGVALDQILRLGAYEAALVVAPGTLLYAALRGPGSGTAVGLSVGWALGYAIEIGAFAVAGELGAAWVQPALQSAVVVACAAVVLARRRSAHRPRPPGGSEPPWSGSAAWRWAVASGAALAIVYIAVASFTQTPLPGHFERVDYFRDLVFHLGLAAEALHHWPITDPGVVGASFPYHTFIDMHLAAVSRVTGIDLPTILFRLYLVPLLSLFALQVAVAGSFITGRRWAGPAAAGLVLFVGEVDPSPDQPFAFANLFFFYVHKSPSFTLGLVFFVPALLLIWSLSRASAGSGLASPGDRVGRRAQWVALAMLLAACTGAKVTLLPVLAGGMVTWLVLGWLIGRRGGLSRFDPPVAAALVLAGGMFLAAYAVVYSGGSGGLAFRPPGSAALARPVALVDPSGLDPPLAAIFWTAATALWLIGYCGPLLAPIAAAAVIERGWLLHPRRLFLLAFAAASLAPTLAVADIGVNQNFFFSYGQIALAMLAADGLLSVLGRLASVPGLRPRHLALVSAAAAATVAAVSVVAILLLGRSREIGLYLVAAAVIAALGAAGASAAVRLRRGGRATTASGLIVVALAATTGYGALDAPLDVLPGLYDRWRGGQPLHELGDRHLSPELLAGLTWLRANTDDHDVLAVNNHWVASGRRGAAFRYYSAFAERRVFLEGWMYARRALEVGLEAVVLRDAVVYPGRLTVNEAVFGRADPAALRRLVARYGVDYLVVDKLNRGPSPALARLARPLFSNSAIEVYSAPAALAAADRRRQAHSSPASVPPPAANSS